MISIVLNGEPRKFAQPLTCGGLVAELGLEGKRIALEQNGEIVPRSRLKEQAVADGDQIEIVVAVGGG